MYIETFDDLVTTDPYPMYQKLSELIEADGEAEDIFLQGIVDNGYAERYFYAVDEKYGTRIELDITDYIGDKAFEAFEKAINNYSEEDGDLTEAKVNSWYLACIKAKR